MVLPVIGKAEASPDPRVVASWSIAWETVFQTPQVGNKTPSPSQTPRATSTSKTSTTFRTISTPTHSRSHSSISKPSIGSGGTGTNSLAAPSTSSSLSSSTTPTAVPFPHAGSNKAFIIAISVVLPVVAVLLVLGLLLWFFWRRGRWPFAPRRASQATSKRPLFLSTSNISSPEISEGEKGQQGFFQPGDTGITGIAGDAGIAGGTQTRDFAQTGENIPAAAVVARKKLAGSASRWAATSLRGISRKNGQSSTNGDDSGDGDGHSSVAAQSTKSFKTQLLDGLGSFMRPNRQPTTYPEVAYLYDPPVATKVQSAPLPEQSTSGPQSKVQKASRMLGRTPTAPAAPQKIDKNQPEMQQARALLQRLRPIIHPRPMTEQLQADNEPANMPALGMVELYSEGTPTTASSPRQKGPIVTEHPAFKEEARPVIGRNPSSMTTIGGSTVPKERVPIMLDEQSVTTSPLTNRRSEPLSEFTFGFDGSSPPVERRTSEITTARPERKIPEVVPALPSPESIYTDPRPSPPPPPEPTYTSTHPVPPIPRPIPDRLITDLRTQPRRSSNTASTVSPVSTLLPTAVSETIRDATAAYLTPGRSQRRSVRVSNSRSPPLVSLPVSESPVSRMSTAPSPLNTQAMTTNTSVSPQASGARRSRHSRNSSRNSSLDKPLPALPMPTLIDVPSGMETNMIEEEEHPEGGFWREDDPGRDGSGPWI